MTVSTRRLLLLLTLVATLIAAYYAPKPGDDGVALTERAVVALPTLSAAQPDGLLAHPPLEQSNAKLMVVLDRGEHDDAHMPWTVLGGAVAVPAALHGQSLVVRAPSSVQPNTPVATDAVVPQVEEPPPLPFKVLGRATEEGRESVFLQYGEQNLVVRVGDRIGDRYRVERLGSQVLTLTYLPLNSVQTLDISGAN